MRQYTLWVLALVGLCGLGVAGTVLADDKNHKHQKKHEKHKHHISAPEIDVGAAAGALTIAAGTLALLAERLRPRRR